MWTIKSLIFNLILNNSQWQKKFTYTVVCHLTDFCFVYSSWNHISHSSWRLLQTNWQMVALWRRDCFWHYVKRVALDRVNYSKACRRAQLCSARDSFYLAEKSEFISSSLVSVSRPQPMAASHDWHTRCDSPKLWWRHAISALNSYWHSPFSQHKRQTTQVDIHSTCPRQEKRDMLLRVNVSYSHRARERLKWVSSSSQWLDMYCIAVRVASSSLWNCII